MQSKYYLAIKFFTETKNDEQLKLCYKEIEGFLQNFYEFKFFIELKATNIDPKVFSRLDHEEQKALEDERIRRLMDDYKFRTCEDIFSNYNYNFELFKYALDKIFEEERKIKEEEDAKIRAMQPSVFQRMKSSNLGFWFTIAMVAASFATIIYHYHNFNFIK